MPLPCPPAGSPGGVESPMEAGSSVEPDIQRTGPLGREEEEAPPASEPALR